jgi:hypothetical protein
MKFRSRMIAPLVFIKSNAKKVIPESIWNILLKLKKLKDLKLLYYRFILWLAKDKYISSWPIRILLGPSKEIRKFDNINHYALSEPHHVQFLNRESQQLAYSVPVFDGINASKDALNQIPGYEKFLIEIRNAHIIGGSNLLLVEDNVALYEMKFRDIRGKFSYSDEAILYYNNRNCLIKSIPADMAIQEGIFLGGNYRGGISVGDCIISSEKMAALIINN